MHSQAEKYIHDHNNPITKKVKLFESKLFTTKLQNDEDKEKCLSDLENSFKHTRVDRRVARAIADWLPEKNVSKVLKTTGALANFGTQNKNGKFLNPEQTLFLLEMNKLELRYKGVPVSIEEAFKNVPSFENYIAYKQLALHGYKLKPNDKKKIPQEDKNLNDEPPAKIAKVENQGQSGMATIFEKLRQCGPKQFHQEGKSMHLADYCVQAPHTTGKTKSFGLAVCTNPEYASKDYNSLSTYAVLADDNVALYKFYNTNIPIL